MMPPKILAKNADRQGGVLPVSAAARAGSTKAPAPRLKLEVRRLPPGLTLTEFEEALGEDWKLSNGKVDWREYRQGKTRLAGSNKVPEQSRCYIHVTSEANVREFEKKFLEVVFHDKAGTHKNPDLKHLAPTLGFAPNQRTPLQQTRARTDNRQGTIDQDPEFIAFLEAETQPITKASGSEAAENNVKPEKPKTTPLIEDLREKKASKVKAAQAKAERAEKDKKAAKTAAKESAAAVDKDGGKTTQQQKVEQAMKDVGKVANKQAAAKQTQQVKIASPARSKKQGPTPKTATQAPPSTPATSSTPSPAPQRVPLAQRQRGNAEGIKKMLQKDLGIRPKSTPSAQAATATTAAASTSSPAAPSALTSTSTTPSQASAPPKAPSQKPTYSNQSDAKPSLPKAYLKHANPSQGMTEILIQQALAQYGDMGNVTIDPRKGTAIAVFKDAEGLKKALEAKRVPVANGAVEVLEFRERGGNGGAAGRGGFRGGRGGRGGSRGGNQGGAAAGGSAAAAASASAAPPAAS